MDDSVDVVVVGAGMAGLAAARDLTNAGLTVRVLERGPSVGGRVASDVVDGFTLDRGFQVLNTSYPQVRRRLDLAALDVGTLTPGALVRQGGALRRVGNPLHRPTLAWDTLFSGLLPLPDLVRLGLYSARVGAMASRRTIRAKDVTAAEAFEAAGLGGAALERFLRPFLSGVLLEQELSTSRRYVDLVWRSFIRGQSVLPRKGMGAIGQQLAAALPAGCLSLNTAVTGISVDGADTEQGRVDARFVLVATDPRTATGWLGLDCPQLRTATTYYHCTEELPLSESIIVLDGEGSGPVVNTVVLTHAVPQYAPPGQSLISSTVLGPPLPEAEVLAHLRHLYGRSVASWRLVDVVEVPDALPAYPPGSRRAGPARVNGIYVAGDHRATPSLQGALASGTEVAHHVVAAARWKSLPIDHGPDDAR